MTRREGAGLAVAHLDAARDWRGGQAQVLQLMTGLARHGVRSTLLAPPGLLLERARGAAIDTVSWRARGDADLGALLAAARHLGRIRPDVVHCHGARAHAVGVPAARLAGIRRVVVSRRVEFPPGRDPLSALKYRFGVDRYLCVSRAALGAMRAAGIPERKLALVRSGVTPLEPASGENLRARLGAPEDAPLIGTVAALTAEKDHATLLEAAALAIRAWPAARFAWIGEGERRAALEARRRELGLEDRVHLLGFRRDIAALVPQFTLFVLASRIEGLSNALLEAQWLGVPIVATRAGGIPEVVEHGTTGWLVPPGDPTALAEGIVLALGVPERRRQWADAGRESVRAFHIERTVERTLEEYLSGDSRAEGAA